MRRLLARVGARALLLTSGVDRVYRWFDRLRSELVVAFASDAMLDRFNELAYGGAPRYRPESGVFRDQLFPFEERALERFFPPPPARILVGGSGGGREALALAERGYHVVAFDPSGPLIEQLRYASGDLPIEAQVGAYEDLEQMFPDATFDGAIFGWGSFSHVRSAAGRIDALREYARLTTGPILVSFLALRTQATPRLRRFRRLLPRRARGAGDVFAMSIGLYHPVDEDEVRNLAAEARLRVLELNFDTRETSWPHAVLQRH